MKRIQGRYKKNTLVIAVLMAIGGTAQAVPDHTDLNVNVDAWSFSGEDARAEAMQSNYVNLNDSYNLWVNPALVAKYSNRIDVNAVEDGDGETFRDRGETGAGAYKTFGDNTFGAFLGRPSNSLLAPPVPITPGPASDAFYLNMLYSYATTFPATTGTDKPLTQDVVKPANQFDLFWGTSAVPAVDMGVRLNFQSITNEIDFPEVTSASPNALPSPFTGTLTTDTITSNRSDATASELNLAFGVVDKAGAWDAALLLGAPSSDSTAKFADERVIETHTASAVTARTINTFNGKQSISSDGASNIGLAGRLHNIIPDSILALQYQSLNNSYESTISGSYRTQVDSTIGAPYETDSTTAFIEKGKYDNKGSSFAVFFTQNFIPTPNNLILATVGMVSAQSKAKTVNTVTSHSVTNNLTGATAYNGAGFPELGKQTNGTTTMKTFALPLIVAFEGGLTANTTARAALRKDLYKSNSTKSTIEVWEFPDTGAAGPAATTNIKTLTAETNDTEIWNTPTTLSLGAGYKDGSLAVDAVVEKEFVTLGTDNGLVSRVNVTYLIP